MAAYKYHRAFFGTVVPSLSESVCFVLDYVGSHHSSGWLCGEDLYHIS